MDYVGQQRSEYIYQITIALFSVSSNHPEQHIQLIEHNIYNLVDE